MIQKKKHGKRSLLVDIPPVGWRNRELELGLGVMKKLDFLVLSVCWKLWETLQYQLSISFFFQATVEWDWHWRIFVLSTGFCLKIEKGLNSLSCGNFFPLNHLCCMNDRATSLLVPESYNASTSVFQCPNIRIFWCWTWPKKEEWIDL